MTPKPPANQGRLSLKALLRMARSARPEPVRSGAVVVRPCRRPDVGLVVGAVQRVPGWHASAHGRVGWAAWPYLCRGRLCDGRSHIQTAVECTRLVRDCRGVRLRGVSVRSMPPGSARSVIRQIGRPGGRPDGAIRTVADGSNPRGSLPRCEEWVYCDRQLGRWRACWGSSPSPRGVRGR
jgi:hypothetical protein